MAQKSERRDRRHLTASQIRLICSLALDGGKSQREIARQLQVSTSTPSRLINRALRLGVKTGDDLRAWTDEELYQRFFPTCQRGGRLIPGECNARQCYIPDFAALAQQAWESHRSSRQMYADYQQQARQAGADCFSRSYFYRMLRPHLKRLLASSDYYLAQDFAYGQQIQLDFTGDRYQLLTPGGLMQAWVMTVAWPASYYVQGGFVLAQSTAESCRVLGDVLRSLKCRPLVAVVDNARCWITRHEGTEVIPNEAFAAFMRPLGICIEAAPPRRPRRKSATEHAVSRTQAVLGQYRATLQSECRTVQEHSLWLQERLDEEVNRVPFRSDAQATREYLFRTYELPACLPLGEVPEYLGEPETRVVPRSYQVEVNGHHYSVPYQYIGQTVDIYTGTDFIIIQHGNSEIARHLRQDGPGRTVERTHMPPEHQNIIAAKELYGTPEALLKIAQDLDPWLYKLCVKRLEWGEQEGQPGNALSSCRAMLRVFRECPSPDTAAQACRQLLNHAPRCWSARDLRELVRGLMVLSKPATC